MQNVLRFEKEEFFWFGEAEGWFDVADANGIHASFLMTGDGHVSLYLKDEEPLLSFDMMKELWNNLERKLRDSSTDCHKRLMKLQGYL